MHYHELPLPAALDNLVAAVWVASVPEDGAKWVEQEAVPDGCVELIRRHSGRSVWRREQPEVFVTGLATCPARLRLGAGSRFTGVKLWPWAWHLLGGAPCRSFADNWIAIAGDSPIATLIEGTEREIIERLIETFAPVAVPALAAALLEEPGVSAIARRASISVRKLQRDFQRDFGMPPRSYLRLLRFRSAMTGVHAHASLADAAAAEGYADQAHMAREFRSLAGVPPSVARSRAKGPFV